MSTNKISKIKFLNNNVYDIAVDWNNVKNKPPEILLINITLQTLSSGIADKNANEIFTAISQNQLPVVVIALSQSNIITASLTNVKEEIVDGLAHKFAFFAYDDQTPYQNDNGNNYYRHISIIIDDNGIATINIEYGLWATKSYVDEHYVVAGKLTSTTIGTGSTAEGLNNTSTGYCAHAEGGWTIASGNYSNASGHGTTAKNKAQHTFGEYNILDTSNNNASNRGNYIEIVGNGADENTRSNARTLDWSGNETLAGKLTVGAAPTANMDVATKQYVDSNIRFQDIYYLVSLDSTTGAVDDYAAALTYNAVEPYISNRNRTIYLDIIFGTARFYAQAVQTMDTNNGPIKFIGTYIGSDSMLRMAIFSLDTNDNLTVIHQFVETWSNKVQSIISNSTNTLLYPSTKAVFDEFQRKPVTIWETDSVGLTALGSSITANPSWQLTNLDFTPYKRIKIYTKAGQKSSGVGIDASVTPAVVLEMSLDSRAAGPIGGHYLSSVVGQKPNDTNRLFTVTCAVSSDKTSFAVLQMSSIYGTAATSNSDVNGYVFKIEGYYD